MLLWMRWGFLRAVQTVLRIKEDSLASFGLPCTCLVCNTTYRSGYMHEDFPNFHLPWCRSFVWINRGTHGRSEEPLGRTHVKYVRNSNILTARCCFLAALCTIRGAYFMIEQPSSSIVTKFPLLQHLQEVFGKSGIAVTNTFLSGAYSQSSLQQVSTEHVLAFLYLSCMHVPSWMASWGHWTCKPSKIIGTVCAPQVAPIAGLSDPVGFP